LSQDIWVWEDEDFGKEFYEIPEATDEVSSIFSLSDAIAIVCFLGASADGVSAEEQSLLFVGSPVVSTSLVYT
jgi:hypothetical protein